MANLDNNSNIYANLAQASYSGRPVSLPYSQKKWNETQLASFKNNESVKFKFPNAKDFHKNDASTVYLQPDNTVKTVEETNLFGRTNEYKKGLLTDEKAGFNAYYVTDTPTLNQNTKHTYFAIRGSDGGTNDWINNNAAFTVGDAHIPQAKLATEAIHQKITELRKATPDATMSVTGHSLGTMVSIQAVANLPKEDISKIDKVILFQGPDARDSINKMSKQAQKNIRELEEQGKIEYYVNAFDIVSMLNRNKKGVDEIGKVHYLLPKTFTSTFEDIDGYPGSSHDFGQYQLNTDGTPKVANLKEHPYIFSAGIKLSNLIDKYLKKLLQNTGIQVRDGNVLAALAGDAVLFKKFMDEYDKIVAAAKVASKWQGKVSKLQEKIGSASGSKKIELRAELASAVSEEAKRVGDEYMIILKNEQQEALDEITTVASEIKKGANAIRHYLSYSEVQQLISPYKKSKLWDSGQETSNISQAKQYKEKVTSFSEKLSTVANNIQDYDGKAGQTLFK